jgi:hypothetical protein
MEEQETKRIWYADIIELGFSVDECKDNVFEREYGYPYRIITKKLTKNISIEYRQPEGTCRVYRTNKDGYVLGEIELDDIESIKVFIEFYKEKK